MNAHNDPRTADPGARNSLGYILHLWCCAGQWRASLENLKTGKRFGFENLERLFAYLMDLIEGKSDAGTASCECDSTNPDTALPTRKGDIP